MPTDLPPDFHGTGKPRSTPNPKIPTEVNLPEKHWVEVQPNPFEGPDEGRSYDDGPVWLQLLILAVFLVGVWRVGGWIIDLIRLAF